MKGTYKFFQEGVLLGESENLVTTAGRQHIMRFMGGLVGTLAGTLAVGIGTTAANAADERLTFEFERAIVSLSSVDFINNRIVFKGTLNQGLVGTIYEAGLFSDSQLSENRGYDSRLLYALGSSTTGTWTNATYVAGNNRLAPNALRVTAPTSSSTTATLSNLFIDLSGYSTSDTFKIAFKPNNAFVTNFKIRFLGTDPASYYEATVVPSGTDYQIATFTKGSLTKVGTTVDYASISAISLVVTSTGGGSGVIDFDALRIEDMDTLDKNNILVSRSVLLTPIAKTDIVPLDIEYALDVSVV